MAKIYGLNGVLRGRQGNNVFSVQNGTQVVKAYQPVVANPRSELQKIQRSKFALAGKISGMSPSEAFVGLVGSSERSRRARLVSLLIKACTVTPSGADYIAAIPFRDFVWSEGSLNRYSATASVVGTAVDHFTVTATVNQLVIAPTAPVGYGELCVVALFDPTGSRLDGLQAQVRTTTAANTFTFRRAYDTSVVLAAWVCPFVAGSRDGAFRSGNVGYNEAQNAAQLTASLASLLAAAQFGMSVFLNSVNVIVPAQANAMPNDDDNNRSVAKKK